MDFPDFENFTEKEVEEISQSIPRTDNGLIEYRKYIWALKFAENKVEKLEEYKRSVVEQINETIAKKEKVVNDLKEIIKSALIVDPNIERTKTGGRTLNLPDIGIVSVTAPKKTIEIYDEKAVLEALGNEFGRVKVELDKPMAKKFLLEKGEVVNGAEVRYGEQQLRIKYNKK